jgi:hypothetical protein
MRRTRLWQAIAGMSVALAVAAVLVSIQLAKSLAHRTNYMNRRVSALNTTVRELRRQASDLKRQTSAVQRKLGSARERATVGETFGKILFAQDLRTIKLTPPGEKPTPQEAGRTAVAILAMSESAQAAMLEVKGLNASGDKQVYRIWWMPKRGAAVWAADFIVGDDGQATVPVDLPPARQNIPTIEVTLENESYSEAPSGAVALKGRLPK